MLRLVQNMSRHNETVELVTSCRPWIRCMEAVSARFPAVNWAMRDVEARSATFAKQLSLSNFTGGLIFDQLRCARGQRIRTGSSMSSFWQQITRLHRRLRNSDG